MFCSWYYPNLEQAGFREKQGCLLQLFCIYLMMDSANINNSDLMIAFMDYEKAFDYVNRGLLIKNLIDNGIDGKFATAIRNMYEQTYYLPKTSNSKTSAEIKTEYGLTQCKTSSANFFSFYVSDMPRETGPSNSFIIQLADDTAILATSIDALVYTLRKVFNYSDKKRLVTNMKKTKFLDLSTNPKMEPLQITDGTYIEAVGKEGYRHLGVTMIQSRFVHEHILKNIREKKGNAVKFFAWIDNNKYTPIKVKLQILYTCVLPAIIYGGEIDKVKKYILQIERLALKRCLGVKRSTPDDIIYIEVNRPEIIAVIKDRQFTFYRKLVSLREDEAIVKQFMKRCKNSNMMMYYDNLEEGYCNQNISERKTTFIEYLRDEKVRRNY